MTKISSPVATENGQESTLECMYFVHNETKQNIPDKYFYIVLLYLIKVTNGNDLAHNPMVLTSSTQPAFTVQTLDVLFY